MQQSDPVFLAVRGAFFAPGCLSASLAPPTCSQRPDTPPKGTVSVSRKALAFF